MWKPVTTSVVHANLRILPCTSTKGIATFRPFKRNCKYTRLFNYNCKLHVFFWMNMFLMILTRKTIFLATCPMEGCENTWDALTPPTVAPCARNGGLIWCYPKHGWGKWCCAEHGSIRVLWIFLMTGYYIISILVHTLYFLHVHIFIYNSRLLTAIVLWESSLCWLGNIQVGKKIRNSHMAYMWHIHTYVHIYMYMELRWSFKEGFKA